MRAPNLALFACAIVSLFATSSAHGQAPMQVQSADVRVGDQAYDELEIVADGGLTFHFSTGYFHGKRTLTAYEFAVIVDRVTRLLDNGEGERILAAVGRAKADKALSALEWLADRFGSQLRVLGRTSASVTDAVRATQRQLKLPPDRSSASQHTHVVRLRGDMPGLVGVAIRFAW